jgi:hypothetical protein
MIACYGDKLRGVFTSCVLFFILVLSSNTFAAGSPFSGIYSGTSGGPGCEPGQFFVFVKEDGTFNLLAHADLGVDDFLTNFVKEGVVIAGDGTFATSATVFDGEEALNISISGTFVPPAVSGIVSDDSGCAGTFTGSRVTGSGPLARAGGYYTGTADGTVTLNGLPNGTFTGTVSAIVAADGSGLMVHNIELTVLGEPIDPFTIGGPITVDSLGNFSEILDDITVTGAINTTNFTGGGTTSAVFVEIEGTFVESGTFTLARQFPLPSPFRNDVVASLPGTGVVVLFNDNTSSITLDPDAAEGISIGDFDNNGGDDVIARFADGDGPTNSGGAWISENQGALTLLTPNPPEEVAVGNFDGVAGDDRFLASPAGLSLILNGGPPVLITALPPVAMAAGDVDGNGQDDVVLSFSSIGTIVLRNLSVVDVLDSTPADDMKLGDIDGNGQDDIFASFAPGNGPGGTGGLFFSVNQGVLSPLTPLETLNMTSGDFDGSGQDDFLLDFGGATGLVLLLNGATVSPLGVLPVVAMASGDVDSNGQDDMILSITGVGTIAFKNLTTVEVLDPAVALDLDTGNVDGN